eukprot:GHVU01202424.1.p1 GENE.GHVU01202424.1~~GHVU01202424.1.p1  ORF type:complete len:368 (+),score=24.41 GHVU01202424.1:935-2038(+)
MESLFVRVTYRSYISAETDDIPSGLYVPETYSLQVMNDLPEESEQPSDDALMQAISDGFILRFWEVVSHRCTHGRLLLQMDTELNDVHKVDSKKPTTLQLDASETVLLDLRNTGLGLSDPPISALNDYTAVLSRLKRPQQNNDDVSAALSSFITIMTQRRSAFLLNFAMQVIRKQTTATADKAVMCVRATFGTGAGLAGSYAGVILQATASLTWDPENLQKNRTGRIAVFRSGMFDPFVELLIYGQIFDDCRNTADGTELLEALGDQLPQGRQWSALRFLADIQKAKYGTLRDCFMDKRVQELTMEEHRVAYLLDVLNDILWHMSKDDTESLSSILGTQTEHTKEAAIQCVKEMKSRLTYDSGKSKR